VSKKRAGALCVAELRYPVEYGYSGRSKRCRLSLFLSRKGSIVDWPAILGSSTDWQQTEDRERVEG